VNPRCLIQFFMSLNEKHIFLGENEQDPLLLSQCTVSYELELPHFFEVHHMVSKESYICQTVDAQLTAQWLQRLRSLSVGLGRWKQRRNALPHVMMIN